jgi:3-oxoacyl-[acyl-carrier protein] reductase
MSLSFNFKGQSVIVTGASRGIGLEIARLFARASADVFIVDLPGEALEEASEDVGAYALAADVSVTQQVADAVTSVVDRTGRIDVLVNNAGVLRDRVLWKLEDDDWSSVLNVHGGGTFRFTRACLTSVPAITGGW